MLGIEAITQALSHLHEYEVQSQSKRGKVPKDEILTPEFKAFACSLPRDAWNKKTKGGFGQFFRAVLGLIINPNDCTEWYKDATVKQMVDSRTITPVYFQKILAGRLAMDGLKLNKDTGKVEKDEKAQPNASALKGIVYKA